MLLSRRLNDRPALIAVPLIAAVAAVIFWPTNSPAGPPAACAVVIDVDEGTRRDPELVDRYLTWLGPIVGDCARRNARLHVIPATDRTATDTVAPVDVHLELSRPTGNPRFDAPQIDALASDAVARTAAMLDRAAGTHAGTDLLAAARAVAPVLARAEDRDLYLLTNSIHTRHPHNLAVLPLGDDDIVALVGDLTDDGLIPDLAGTTVHIIGAGVGTEADELPSQRLAAIEGFWHRFFAGAGATLKTYARSPV